MLHEIGVAQIDRFIVERSHLNKKTVANHLTLLGAMLNAAKDIGWLALVPRIRKPKVRIFSSDFSYLRTDEETQVRNATSAPPTSTMRPSCTITPTPCSGSHRALNENPR